MTNIRNFLFAAMLTAILFTCEKIPDYCGTGEIYDPGCEFCFGSRAFPLCGNGRYNPLTGGCDQNGRVGTRCSDGSVVPSGTPCGGYTLTVATAPADVGDVTYNLPTGLTYTVGDMVVLSAAPKEKYKGEYEFTGWAGAQPSGGAMGATYVMGNNDNGNNAGRSQVTIVAMFKPAGKGKLITEAFPKEHGGVARNPDKETYDNGESVTVKAEPNTGYTFIGWSGANTSETEEITISMDESKTLVAMFAPVAHTLRADVYPPDGGAVFVNSAAFAGNAAQNVEANIALWAREGEGYVFDKWTGTAVEFEDAGKQGTKATLLDAGATITANFRRGSGGGTAVAPPTVCILTIDVYPAGGGSVSRSPNQENYTSGANVTVTATANEGYTFTGWSGALTVKDSVLKITMNKNMELYANFQENIVTPPDHVHTYGDWEVTIPATCDAAGEEMRTCTQDASHKETRAIAKLTGASCSSGGGGDTAVVSKYYVKVLTENAGGFYPKGYNWGDGGYTVGEKVTITANEGGGDSLNQYFGCVRFKNWMTASPSVSFANANNTATTFTMPANDVTVTAVYENTYAFWVSAEVGGKVTVSPNTEDKPVVAGTQFNITATADPGYTFDRWDEPSNSPNCVCCGGVPSIIDNRNSATTNITVNGHFYVAAYFSPEITPNNCGKDGTAGSCNKATIGGKTWMTENLNRETASGSYCYDNDPTNCDKYGRMYDWMTAMTACPTGYQLPTRLDWGDLAKAAGGTGEYGASGTAGKALKSTNGWYNNGNGTDDYGFSALPGGYHFASFSGAGSVINWWTATEISNIYVYYRNMNYRDDNVNESTDHKSSWQYVRCVYETPSAVVKGTFTDSRDGQIYKTVKIETQTWIAENLNWEAASGSVCYGNRPDSCAKYGRLYTWDAAMTACPTGYHLPTRLEWRDLAVAAGGTGEYGDSGTAGKALKSTRGWSWDTFDERSGNGTDDFGFSALPGGFCSSAEEVDGYGGCYTAGQSGGWWTATEHHYGISSKTCMVYTRLIGYNNDYLFEGEDRNSAWNSVRCLAD